MWSIVVSFVVQMDNLSPLVFYNTSGGQVKLDRTVIENMHQFAQHGRHSKEAGGVLVGRHIIKSNNIVIDNISTPTTHDRRSHYRFFRSRVDHQSFIDNIWRESRATCNYLGEWHTHPEQIPTPSSLDLSEWKRKLSEDIFGGDYLYFIIVGISCIRMWEGNKKNGAIIFLPQIT